MRTLPTSPSEQSSQLPAGELHVFCLWNNALSYRIQFLECLAQNFLLLATFSVTWSDALADRNLERLYHNDPGTRERHQKIGRGPFLVAVVRDESPRYAFDMLPSGDLEYINTNVVDAKRYLRSVTESPQFRYNVHSSNSAKEANRDATLILGVERFRELQEYRGLPQPLDYPVGDVSGAQGWRSWNDLLDVMNLGVDYVFLRPYRDRSVTESLDPTIDVDVLVASQPSFTSLVNAMPTRSDARGNHFLVSVDEVEIMFDVRSIGDSDADANWQAEMLLNHIRTANTKMLCDEDMFFYLLYHYYSHKTGFIPAEQLTALRSIARDLFSRSFLAFLDANGGFLDFTVAAKLLGQFFRYKKYSPIASQILRSEPHHEFWKALSTGVHGFSEYREWLRTL
jgi:hypothetical protein